MQKITMVYRDIPGIDDELRASLVVGLNQNLASLTDLATAYKQAHWNVVGIDFAQLHVLFDQFADQTRDYVDLIAERAVTIGGVARGTIQAAVEHSTLPAFAIEERDEVRLLEELVRRTDILTADQSSDGWTRRRGSVYRPLRTRSCTASSTGGGRLWHRPIDQPIGAPGDRMSPELGQ